MRLFSHSHDLKRLEARLLSLLTAPTPPKLLEAALHRPDHRLPGRRQRWRLRLFSWLDAWRAQGYALNWLIQRLPGVRDVVNLAWALLTIQGRLYRLALAIQETQNLLKQLQHALRAQGQLAEQRSSLLAKRLEDLHGAHAFMQHEIEHLAARLHEEQTAERLFIQREIDLLAARLRALEPAPAHTGRLSTGPTPSDCWYQSFEGVHRGPPELIQARQRTYLPFIQAAIPDRAAGWVLDLGCGGGEWLALLTEAGFKAEGIDINPNLIAAARQKGLRVHQADLFEYLRMLANCTYAAVTAFQVIEHLPLEALLDLFAEARRILRPGGVLILETPNPENIQVAAYSFWLDPTHLRPLPPPLLVNLAVHFGLIDIRIERLNPWPQYRPELDDALHKLLYCGQDYALIARVPVSA
ncbi:methyltransferase domain-containing protein [Caldichromatium japonicum]|uniref:Methyltransferase domain-containing protein n=1 Tax=Caldichromatium japonicum TaxID=2699430 RepID=A0A6G7VA64_9GAMM|nr:class I SAM-dependent methyltransferase [Caldichromatium japonicum]QIK36800.1 methyltransferase domain-containing protein [Caldichromatium japonicum]